MLPESIRSRPKIPYRAPIRDVFFGPGSDRSLLEPGPVHGAGLLNEDGIARLVAKFADGRPVSETDEMALAGSMSLMILHERLVANPRLAPALEAVPGRRGRQGRVPGRPGRGGRVTQRLVQDSLLASASAVPEKIAIADEYQQRTYAELSDDALRFARVLQDAGLERGDRVGLYLDNTVECAAAIFGVLIAGGAFTFINPQTKAAKLAFILNDSEARFLVTEAHSAGIAAAAVAEAPSVEQTFTTHREGSPEHFRDLREAIGGVAPEPAAAGTDPF